MEQNGKRQQLIFVDSPRTGKEEFSDHKKMTGGTDRKELADSLNNRHYGDLDDIDNIH